MAMHATLPGCVGGADLRPGVLVEAVLPAPAASLFHALVDECRAGMDNGSQKREVQVINLDRNKYCLRSYFWSQSDAAMVFLVRRVV